MEQIIEVIIDDRVSSYADKSILKEFKKHFSSCKTSLKNIKQYCFADYVFREKEPLFHDFVLWDKKQGESLGIFKFISFAYEMGDYNVADAIMLTGSKCYDEKNLKGRDFKRNKVNYFLGESTGKLFIRKEECMALQNLGIPKDLFFPATKGLIDCNETEYFYLKGKDDISCVKEASYSNVDNRTEVEGIYFIEKLEMEFPVTYVSIRNERNTAVTKDIFQQLKSVLNDLEGIPLISRECNN